ncbi:MAG: zf-HC2 domain-containing protein, partial [Lentisphaeria bacterium]|nr:zf-HC2 domain-containing protein [Lentisphaeria bacterium]
MKECEAVRPLLSGMLDGELTPEQAVEVNGHLTRCEACRTHFEELREACSPLDELGLAAVEEAQLGRMWKRPGNQLAKTIGWLMLLGGWLFLMTLGAVEFARDRTVDLPLKLAVASMLGG